MTDEVRPVFSVASAIRFLYDFLSTNFSGSTGAKDESNSVKLSSSQIRLILCCAVILMWNPHLGQTLKRCSISLKYISD